MQVDILKASWPSLRRGARGKSKSHFFWGDKARFGARKIKQVLKTQGLCLTCRCIGHIMKRLSLVCVYSKAAFQTHSKGKNEASVPNYLNREFNNRKPLEVLVLIRPMFE